MLLVTPCCKCYRVILLRHPQACTTQSHLHTYRAMTKHTLELLHNAIVLCIIYLLLPINFNNTGYTCSHCIVCAKVLPELCRNYSSSHILVPRLVCLNMPQCILRAMCGNIFCAIVVNTTSLDKLYVDIVSQSVLVFCQSHGC
jgi:hypothetical protein